MTAQEEHEKHPPSPLRSPAYRRLFAAQVTSLAGTGLSTVALALLVHDLAGGNAGVVLGTVLALKVVAYVVIAPAIGGVAHRLPRKSFLIMLDAARAALVLCLPFVDALWQVYALIVMLNVAASGFTPIFQATIPDVLPDEARYTRALSLSRLAYDLENLAGPTLAALALSVTSYSGLFVVDGLTFIASAIWVATTAVPPTRTPERVRGLFSNMTFGIHAYLATPRLRGLLALHAATSAAGAMVIVNTVVYVRERLLLGETETAWAMAATGAGSMTTALAIPRLLSGIPVRTLMLAGGGLVVVALGAGGWWMPHLMGER